MRTRITDAQRYEWRLVACLLIDPWRLEETPDLWPDNISDRRAAMILQSLQRIHAQGYPVTVRMLDIELGRIAGCSRPIMQRLGFALLAADPAEFDFYFAKVMGRPAW